MNGPIHAIPDPDVILRELPDVGDGISAACATLARYPSADGAETLAARFGGMQRLCMALSSALRTKGGGHD